MLEKLPHAVGHALQGARPGLEATAYHGADFADVPATITVTSSAFADGGAIPPRYTQDGDGVSPQLAWTGVPEEAEAFAILIEDADSPTPAPLVHAIVVDLGGQGGHIVEAGVPSKHAPGDDAAMGKNSFFGAAYLPPDPPPGHGPHRYVIQVYALDRPLALGGHPGRSAFLAAMKGHVLAKGVLVGTYERP